MSIRFTSDASMYHGQSPDDKQSGSQATPTRKMVYLIHTGWKGSDHFTRAQAQQGFERVATLRTNTVLQHNLLVATSEPHQYDVFRRTSFQGLTWPRSHAKELPVKTGILESLVATRVWSVPDAPSRASKAAPRCTMPGANGSLDPKNLLQTVAGSYRVPHSVRLYTHKITIATGDMDGGGKIALVAQRADPCQKREWSVQHASSPDCRLSTTKPPKGGHPG